MCHEPRPELICRLLGQISPPLSLPRVPAVIHVAVAYEVGVIMGRAICGRRVVPLEGMCRTNGQRLHAGRMVEGVVSERVVAERRLVVSLQRRGSLWGWGWWCRADRVVVVRVSFGAEDGLLALIDDVLGQSHVRNVGPPVHHLD